MNFITTGHVAYSEPGARLLINTQLSAGYTLREFNHSHPSGNAVPLGVPILTGDKGDLFFFKTSVRMV